LTSSLAQHGPAEEPGYRGPRRQVFVDEVIFSPASQTGPKDRTLPPQAEQLPGAYLPFEIFFETDRTDRARSPARHSLGGNKILSIGFLSLGKRPFLSQSSSLRRTDPGALE